jgi:hypothetical protein
MREVRRQGLAQPLEPGIHGRGELLVMERGQIDL